LSLTKPSEIFASRVEPAFQDYLANPITERLANNFAEAINSQLEWTHVYYAKKDPSRLSEDSLEKFRRKIFDECPAAKMMWDLADANKHRILERQQTIRRTVTVSTAAYSNRNGELWVNEYEKPFLPEATAAMEYWKNWRD
jgi:hypothetical protein